MASAGLRKELECSICKGPCPETLRCGHNFCRGCIDQMLNTQERSGDYSSRECREELQERPTLKRNITLSNVVKNFWSTQPHQEEITGICCTYCSHSPVPAVRSCLHCEASLCDNHLRVHSKGPEHVLTDPSTSLENRKCSVHKKILEYYCPEDSACVCVSCCLAGEHQGHRMEMLDEASEKKKKKLRNVLQILTTKRKETEERVQSMEELKRKDELSRKMRHIEELCTMTDALTVLQDPDTGDLHDPELEGGNEDIRGHDGGDEDTGGHDGGDEDTGGHDGGDEDTGGHDRGDEDTVGHDGSDEDTVGHDGGDEDTVGHDGGSEDTRGKFFGLDPSDILLDVTTAGNYILISDDLKTATWTEITQNRPETAERFQDYNQVISIRGFTSGRHYWDVQGSRSGLWSVGMCYPSTDRRGEQSLIGYNNKSWCLYGGQVRNNQYSIRRNKKLIPLPYQITSDRVRIYLDYEAGQLSFYELCDPIRHLHTVTAVFSEPLHAAFFVYDGSIKISGRSSSLL